jgi:NADH dehydrogenase/NADH:ubiquinone oxidoreductase subunit G
MITVRLNGSEVQGRPGMTILELARENGIDIPTLCYHSELSLIGACRICSVEVEGARTLVASCHTPIAPGMAIHTHSPKVLQARKSIVELLLASHPDACLVCDKANLCELRKLAADLGVGIPRFRIRKRYYPLEDVSPYIVRDLTKCILCQRCVRACREIKKQDVFAIAYRGFDSKVVVDQDQPLDKEVCRDCDICVSFCPVGALTKREEASVPKRGIPLIMRG